jgi:hypothetical protein
MIGAKDNANALARKPLVGSTDGAWKEWPRMGVSQEPTRIQVINVRRNDVSENLSSRIPDQFKDVLNLRVLELCRRYDCGEELFREDEYGWLGRMVSSMQSGEQGENDDDDARGDGLN